MNTQKGNPLTDTSTTPTPPRMAAPASAVAAVTGAALDDALTYARRLKMPYLRKAMEEVIPTAKAQRWDPAEIVKVLLAEEIKGRDASNLRNRRKRAGFPTGKTFHVWDESASSIPVGTQTSLRGLEWIGRRENLCICGPSGTGKSHFCEALGQEAVDAGLNVAWYTIDDLGALVRRHHTDDTFANAFDRITRADLITVDDIGLLPVSEGAAEGFYRLADTVYERRSLAVSSNLHPSKAQMFPPTCARRRRNDSGRLPRRRKTERSGGTPMGIPPLHIQPPLRGEQEPFQNHGRVSAGFA
jgi:DNA replication protein DnaC